MRLSELLRLVPGSRQLNRALRRRYDPYASNRFLKFASPGHYYSPIPDLELVNRARRSIFDDQVREIPGIDNNEAAQLALLDDFSRFNDEIPFKDTPSPGSRYYYQNPFFSYGDAFILYSMLRHFRPKRIVEVGSGFSSAVMLDTNDAFLSRECHFTFIEPYPERLLSLMEGPDAEGHRIISTPVQEAGLEVFADLGPRDILFIDSTHVAKIGSDVVHLLTHVLPSLKSGVIIHFHDVFWPFEYPEELIRMGVAWNESYVLKAFLQFNSQFRILFFNSYLAIHHRAILESKVPLFLKNTGGSLWIEKILLMSSRLWSAPPAEAWN